MKLITLNIWGGRIKKPFTDFIKSNQDIDIFCFQELYHHAPPKFSEHYEAICPEIFSELQKWLPNHNSFFRAALDDVYGVGIFIKKGINILEEGEVQIYEKINYSGVGGDHSRNMQWIKCSIQGNIYTIFNVHGLWNGKGKTDTTERIKQSERIRKFMDTVNTSKILCGDFNLRPDTKSVEILSKGMVDLVKTSGVTSTRTSLYTKEEKFADYIFVSPDIKVKNFQVLPHEVSDHSPLLLEF